MRIRIALSITLASALCALALLPSAARAWSNGTAGGNSFGTHDWILQEATRLAKQKGAGWVNLKVALLRTDDPDTDFHDTYYHVYDIWGGHYGNAPKRVTEYYAKALSLRKKGYLRKASAMVGLLAHYFGDLNNPLHTDQCAAEDSLHSDYEEAAQAYSDEAGENAAWVNFDGYKRIKNVAARAKSAARAAHASYRTLVDEFATGGMTAVTLRITRQSLNRAANGLADIIINLKKGYGAGGPSGSGGPPSGGGGSGGGGGGSSTKVGITESGECYHRLTCYHWTKDPDGNSVVTVAWAKANGYRPCGVCDPPQ